MKGHGFHGSHLWISRNAKNIDDGRGDIRALSTGAEGLYACALNNAVDAALSSFRKKQNPNICAIRSFGDYQNLEKCTERNPKMTAAIRANPDVRFHVQLRKQNDIWTAAPKHNLHLETKNCFEKFTADKKLDGTKASENTKVLRSLREMLRQQFHHVNLEEARIVVGLVRELLAFKPNTAKGDEQNFARIQTAHIGIIMPYKGQQRLIRNMLTERNRESSESKVLAKVVIDEAGSTTWSIPGSEVDITFISLCVRDPNNSAEEIVLIRVA
ncbi:AAA-12 multi-domain protein [Pyrenophora teres f. teres]|uniref:AAA-12 multi-domain protein n=1 Tax=Pyrenophora teres f. teres TaxID=97479 RepID=A0A6S6WD41_9PLEO|nr:AAA-12 multi-domain protein [Pyrenophora teres f. teres]